MFPHVATGQFPQSIELVLVFEEKVRSQIGMALDSYFWRGNLAHPQETIAWNTKTRTSHNPS